MKKVTKNTYSLDLALQVIFILLMLIGHFGALVNTGMLILGMSAQFFVGCIQVLSGLFHYTVKEDKARGSYLMGAFSYIFFLWLGTVVLSDVPAIGTLEIIIIGLGVLSYIVLPSLIALWYLKTTFDRFSKAPQADGDKRIQTDETLLDDGWVIK